MITIESGRRSAVIDRNHVQLFLRDNKRKAPRAIRQGNATLRGEAEAIIAALMWARKSTIDFGEQEPQQH